MTGRPLPAQTGPASTVLAGVWRGQVVSVAAGDLTVTVARRGGPDGVFHRCESAVFIPALRAGDRVWCAPIEGNREVWAVTARRA